MKRTKTCILITGAAVVVTTVSLTAAAWSSSHRGERGPAPEKMVDRLTLHLDLSEKQQIQARALFTQSFDESKSDRERLMALREGLSEQTIAFDAGMVQTAADEIGGITSRMVYRRASTQASLYQLLDEEQQEEMTELKERREKRSSDSRGRKRRYMW